MPASMCAVIEASACLEETVREVAEVLSAYPYHLVLKGLPIGSRAEPEAILGALSGTDKLSFTKVRIDPGQSGRHDTVTRHSRTQEAMALHTDTAYSVHPKRLVAFQMVRTDGGGGGRSQVVPVADVLARLDASLLRLLREDIFPFSRGNLPILWGDTRDPHMRYYGAQIRQAASSLGVTAPALQELDAVLEQLARDSFRLEAGDILLLDNHRVLHGRTALSMDSQRLLYRYRADTRHRA